MTNTLLIDGKWVAALGGERLHAMNPATGEAFGYIDRGQAGDIDLAVSAAQRALAGPWGRMTATQRGRILQRYAELILKNNEELAQLEALDTGKPITAARNDITAVARYFEYYGAAADKVHGQTIPYLEGYNVSVVREPHGVTAHIIPWNYPAQIYGRTIAPALAMGNATVLKPAEDACLSVLRLGELGLEAGLPPGALNIVTGLGHEAGAALSCHPGINFATFTGSPEVGAMVQMATARNHIPCVLELGGKSPQIVFNDADLERAVPIIVNGIVQNAGQTCAAGSRLLIQEGIYDKLTAMVAASFAASRVGAPEMDLNCGPIISKKQFERVNRFIEEGKAAGIEVLAEGTLAPGVSANGYYVRPILFGRVPRAHSLARDEVFGPVLSAMSFVDEEDAIHLANDTEYGLTAGVWTKDGDRQARMARRVISGQVFINCYGAGGGVELPFGGFKKSGHGREKGFLALEEMSVTKTVVHHYSGG